LPTVRQLDENRLMKIILILIVCFFASSAEAKFSVKRNTNMQFGTIASSVVGSGTATINTNADTKSITGSIFDFGGSVTRAKFQVSGGTPSGFVTITLPLSLTISKGGVSLTVDNLSTDVTNPAQLDSLGKLTIYVRGRLTVPTNQSPKSGLGGSFTLLVQDDSASVDDDASATIAASIVAPISISPTTQLDFGNIAPSSIGGSLTVSTGGASTATNVTELAGASVSQGVLSVTGNGGANFSVSLPVNVTLTSASNSMTVNNFNHDGGATPSISGGGTRTLNIGATLNVGANQPGGSYSGTYFVTVNYN
jgi:hypothetical protein